MFGIGWTEFIIIFLVLLIFVGPRHFPDLLRRFGQLVGELRLASRELRNQLDVDLKDVESPREAAKRAGRELLDSWDSPYGDDDSEREGYAPTRLDQAQPPAATKEAPGAEKETPAADQEQPTVAPSSPPASDENGQNGPAAGAKEGGSPGDDGEDR